MNIFEHARAKREKALEDPGEQAAPAPPPATMSQSQFGKADSPEARARKQRALAEMLRNRQ